MAHLRNPFEAQRTRPSWRAARYVLIALTWCAVGYLAAVNAFLYFNGISLLFKSTNSVNATYQRAYSLWPGVVHADGLRIVFQDKNLQFSLQIKQLQARIVLSELLQRRLHVRWVHGSGTAFRMRHRIQPESRNQPWVGALPPIPEFPAPAVFEPTVPEPPIPDSKYDLWTVQLENVDVAVDEVWIQFVKFAGAARAQGAFRLVPARNLWVGPASLALQQGHLYFGQQSISSQLAGSISCRVDFFDVRIPQGREVFRYINADISVRARDFVPDQFFGFFTSPAVHVASEPAELYANITVHRGRLNPGSKLMYAGPGVIVTSPALALDIRSVRVDSQIVGADTAESSLTVGKGAVGPDSAILFRQLTGSITTEGADLTGDVAVEKKTVAVSSLSVMDTRKLNSLLAGRAPVVFGNGALQASVTASQDRQQRDLDIQVPRAEFQLRHSDLHLALNGAFGFSGQSSQQAGERFRIQAWAKLNRASLLREAETGRALTVGMHSLVAHGLYVGSAADGNLQFRTSVASVSGAIGSSRATRLHGTNLTVSGRLSETLRRLNGDATLTLDSLQVQSRKSELSIKPSARIVFSDFDRRGLTGMLGMGLQFSGWNATYGDDAGQCSALAISKARFDGSARLRKHGSHAVLSGNLAGVRMNWGTDFRVSSDVTVRSHWAGSSLGESGKAKISARLLGAAIVSGKGGTTGWAVTVPELRLESRITRENRLAGALVITAKDTAGRIGGTHVNADLALDLSRLQVDQRSHSAVVDGEVRIRDARLHSGNHLIDDWWATIDVQSAQLVAQENLDLAANFRASLRDATPGLVLLEQEGQLPNWFSDILPLSGMNVRGQAARRCRLTTIRFDQATGGPLTAMGTLQSTSELVRGAFLIRLAAMEVLSAGVEVGPPDSGVSPLVGEEWLRTRTARLDNAARQILSSPCRSEPQLCRGEPVAAQP